MKKGLLKAVTTTLISVILAASVAGCSSSSSKEIKIGLLNEMTGGNATIGTAAANGAKLAIK
ncbi:MAG: hypothetical protein VB122_03545, partial [Erysipelotrichales bacterium]|nr:hypothetical protein [Erysipelotrichales bacterium]